ncbi:MAG: hypothetical protein ACFE0J_03835 [Elainellaceae cyanobacterium]
MSALTVVNFLWEINNMFFEGIHTSGKSDGELSQMLKQLQATPEENYSKPEVSKLIGHIDDAIAHADEPVIERALQRAGLSSEEMVFLLQESRRHVTNLGKLRKSKSSGL